MTYNYPQTQFQYPQQLPQLQAQMPYRQASQIPQVRPVSSIEEVKASPIEFDGSVFYFTDIANRRIYTKQINVDGTASINVYEYKDPTQYSTDQATGSYVTKQEFEKTINELYSMITAKPEETQQPAAQPTPPAKFAF